MTMQQTIDFGNLAVLMGGTGSEREISLQSGQTVLAVLHKQGIAAIGIDLGDNFVSQLQQAKLDTAFIALHGSYGENGVLQAVLESLNIAYTGSDMPACALAMDKWRSQLVWQSTGINTPTSILLNSDNLAAAAQLGFPLAVKPVSEGSSVGISKVIADTQLLAAYNLAVKYDNDVIAQPWISGRELVVGIVNNQPLPVIEIKTSREFYDYAAKYNSDTTQYISAHGLNTAQVKQLQDVAMDAFYSLGCANYGRVDLILDAGGKAYVIEVNTIPGMTSHSLLPMAAKASGMELEQLVRSMLANISATK